MRSRPVGTGGCTQLLRAGAGRPGAAGRTVPDG
jgi:hypothetical protein